MLKACKVLSKCWLVTGIITVLFIITCIFYPTNFLVVCYLVGAIITFWLVVFNAVLLVLFELQK